ncbi:MAG TPA: DUF262 domain-containing protein, partial [Polyangium sp.]|nr:DUF262 domain-containing protein [Polyangium sp.]
MTSSTFSQPNAKTFTPEEIVTEVLGGRVRVPSFQRKFRWQWDDVRRLFDSIAKGYPIGNLLLWERKAEAGIIQLGALEIEASAGTALYVVDGQQRVTSLANALTDGGAGDPRFDLVFNLENEAFQKPESGDPPHLVPLHVIFDLEQVLLWFSQRPHHKKEWFGRATRLTKTIRQYAIPAYIVKQEDEKVLRDIFDRMNNYGRRLSRAEVFSALHGGTVQDGPNLHFSDIAEAVNDDTRFGRLDDDTVLKAVLARRSEKVMREIRGEFKENDERSDFAGEGAAAAYHNGQRALVEAIRFVQEDVGVPHVGFLSYRYLLIVLSRFFALFPQPSQRNKILLRRFFWRATLVGPNVFRGISFATQALLACIEAGKESYSAQALLQLLEQHKPFSLPR